MNRAVATRGARGPKLPPPPLPLQFLNQTRSNCFSFKHQGYYFLRVFRNYTDQKVHNFYHVCYKFWTIYGSFLFFLAFHRGNRSLDVGPSENVRYLTLDLLNSFLLWTIRKTTIIYESLNVKILVESWIY